LKESLTVAKNNCLELILKDTHTCQNDPARFGDWMRLVRRCIAETR